MAFFASLAKVTLLVLSCMFLLPYVRSYTIIMSDSGVPSALIDAPQTGFSMNKAGARTDEVEQEAVYEIMKATGNDWATDIPDVCRGRWHGIECMPDKDNVYHVVSLSFGALSDDTAFPTCEPTRSYISKSITKLPHIRTLFFYRCFSNNPQPIPSFLGQLGPTLQTLVLRENGHVGPIPTELGNLTKLRVLDLHKNNLNGSISVSLSQISGLRSLDLSGNKLTGSIPDLMSPDLSVLDLNQNLLTGSIPASLVNCHSLIKLDLSHNRLAGRIPSSINTLKELILMDLSYNRLVGPIPTSIKNLDSLQALILKGNPMGSAAFPRMKSLMILVLSNMDMHGPIPQTLGQLTSLRVLHLDGNNLNGSIPASFKDLKNLAELRLNDNQLSGPVPFEREMVWRMKRKLKLYNNLGLCYDANSGFQDGLNSYFDSGIGLCEEPKLLPTTNVQHLSKVNEEPISKSSSSPQDFVAFAWLVQLTAIVLLNLFLIP